MSVKWRHGFLLITCIAFLLVVCISSSNAYVLFGGRWGGNGDTYYVLYKNETSVATRGYTSHTTYGAGQWNGISSKYGVQATTGSIYDVIVQAEDLNDDHWADATNYRYNIWGNLVACWDCRYQHSRIRINYPVLDLENSNVKNKVLTHEFGHVAGLNHAPNPAIMAQGDNGDYAVLTDDENGIKAIYGN